MGDKHRCFIMWSIAANPFLHATQVCLISSGFNSMLGSGKSPPLVFFVFFGARLLLHSTNEFGSPFFFAVSSSLGTAVSMTASSTTVWTVASVAFFSTSAFPSSSLKSPVSLSLSPCSSCSSSPVVSKSVSCSKLNVRNLSSSLPDSTSSHFPLMFFRANLLTNSSFSLSVQELTAAFMVSWLDSGAVFACSSLLSFDISSLRVTFLHFIEDLISLNTTLAFFKIISSFHHIFVAPGDARGWSFSRVDPKLVRRLGEESRFGLFLWRDDRPLWRVSPVADIASLCSADDDKFVWLECRHDIS